MREINETDKAGTLSTGEASGLEEVQYCFAKARDWQQFSSDKGHPEDVDS